MICCQAFTFVYYIAIVVWFFQPLSPRDSCKPPKDVGSSLLPPWWLQELLLDTCSCSRQGEGERGEGGGRVTGCSCLRIETHHRLQSCCQGQVLAPSGASCVFSLQLPNVVLSLVPDLLVLKSSLTGGKVCVNHAFMLDIQCESDA